MVVPSSFLTCHLSRPSTSGFSTNYLAVNVPDGTHLVYRHYSLVHHPSPVVWRHITALSLPPSSCHPRTRTPERGYTVDCDPRHLHYLGRRRPPCSRHSRFGGIETDTISQSTTWSRANLGYATHLVRHWLYTFASPNASLPSSVPMSHLFVLLSSSSSAASGCRLPARPLRRLLDSLRSLPIRAVTTPSPLWSSPLPRSSSATVVAVLAIPHDRGRHFIMVNDVFNIGMRSALTCVSHQCFVPFLLSSSLSTTQTCRLCNFVLS